MHGIIMMVIAVDDGNIDSDDNFHNDDYYDCGGYNDDTNNFCACDRCEIHNMSKSSEGRHNNEINNEQGCGGREYSNQITKSGVV